MSTLSVFGGPSLESCNPALLTGRNLAVKSWAAVNVCRYLRKTCNLTACIDRLSRWWWWGGTRHICMATRLGFGRMYRFNVEEVLAWIIRVILVNIVLAWRDVRSAGLWWGSLCFLPCRLVYCVVFYLLVISQTSSSRKAKIASRNITEEAVFRRVHDVCLCEAHIGVPVTPSVGTYHMFQGASWWCEYISGSLLEF